MLEDARGRNATTRAILVIPRKRASLMKEMIDGDMWRRIQYWHKSSRKLFLRPARDSILGCNRKVLSTTVQTILVLELGP